MKGIILAGGLGTRLYPATMPISKCLLPIYDRPMIYYPLSTLMQAGIRDVLIITNDLDKENFVRVLGNGSRFGIKIEYAEQQTPRGIADAFIIGRDFIDGDDITLILGDNIFHDSNAGIVLRTAIEKNDGATVFGIDVSDPERFGVISFDDNFNVLSIEEKPEKPKSNTAVVGLYVYDGNVCKYAENLKPSERGELEITDINKIYLEKGALKARLLGEDTQWFDAGTHESLLETSIFVRDTEKIQGKISCPEKIALEMGFITKERFNDSIRDGKSDYYINLRKEFPERGHESVLSAINPFGTGRGNIPDP